MTAKSVRPEISACAAGAAAGAFAMLLALLPHLDFAAGPSPRVSSIHVAGLQAPRVGQSLYAAAKVGLPPD